MKTRKIVLLSLIAVLLCIYVIQLATENIGSVKEITFDGEPDRIVLESVANGKIILTKKGETWYLGDNGQYETQESEVNILTDALKGFSVLQSVSKGGDEVLYGLDDDAKISMTAYAGNEIICQFDIGKDSSTSLQSYIRMAGEKEILLVSDAYNSVFNVTMDDVRTKNVYYFDPSEITSALLSKSGEPDIMMSRAEDGTWVGNFGQMTSEGIESWISTIAILNTASWLPDNWKPSVAPVGFIYFKIGDEQVMNTIYPVEGETDTYIGGSTACPYYFYMSSYTTEKFLKTADDFTE